jgi:hypothetical protein
MTQAIRLIIDIAARAAPTPIPTFAPSLKEEIRSTITEGVELNLLLYLKILDLVVIRDILVVTIIIN